MYRTLRAALLGNPSFAVLVEREKMKMTERRWAKEKGRTYSA